MAWLKRRPMAAEMVKKAAPLSGGSKVLDAEQQQRSREQMELELAEQRTRRG